MGQTALSARGMIQTWEEWLIDQMVVQPFMETSTGWRDG